MREGKKNHIEIYKNNYHNIHFWTELEVKIPMRKTEGNTL